MWTLLPALLATAPLTFDAAMVRADSAPDVVAAVQASAARRDALDRMSSMTANPLLQAQPGLRVENGATRPEGQLTLQQSFNVAGLASARRGTAEKDLDAARWEARGRRRDLRVAVARAWLETWALTEASRAVLEEEAMAKELVLRIQKAVASDGLTRVDLASARAFAAEARAFHLDLEGQAIEAGGRLSMLLGLAELATVEGPLPGFDGAAAPVVDAAAQWPALKRLEAQVQGERSRGVEASAQYGTGLQVQAQGGHEAPTQWFANVALGVTLPLFDVGRREAGEHEAQARLLEGELDKAATGARVALALLRHELEHTEDVFATVHGQQLPAAVEAAGLQLKRFQSGECTLQELLLVRRLAVAARVGAIRAQAALLAARAHARELNAELSQGDQP
ncbi:MAG: TolC family protein [Myxococcales bacterium]|nr:TolC family protein [Myxococcales bacterium]